MIGNIKQQTKNYVGSVSDVVQRTYNPLLALYSIIGIYQAVFGSLIGLILLGKLQFVNARKKLWLKLIHFGLVAQFGFIFYICLQASTQSTIFAAINDSFISQFNQLGPSDASYLYYQSFVVYSRYLIGWAIMEFLICLPIALINIYALHTRHINYQTLDFQNQDKLQISVPPTNSLNNPNQQVNNLQQHPGGNPNGFQSQLSSFQAQQNGPKPPFEPSKPLEVKMIPK